MAKRSDLYDRNPGRGSKVLLIGIDAATWDILMPLVRQGKVPNIARLMKEGVYGELQSIEPMMSPVVWTSIATGKHPKKHGVTNFYSTQSSLKSLRIWEILAELGMTVGIYEWLLTSPPKPLKEFVIPGWLATTAETFPPNLSFIKELTFQGKKREKSELLGYFEPAFKGLRNGLRLSTALGALLHASYLKLRRPSFYDTHYKTILMKMCVQRDIAAYLLKKYHPDFSAIIFYGTDQIPHHYWKFMQYSKFKNISENEIAKYGGVISQSYQKSDEIVGSILECVSDDTTVLIISDHGMEAVTDVEYVFKAGAFFEHLDFPEKDRLQVQIIKNNLHIGIDAPRGNERRSLQRQLMECLKKITLVEKKVSLFDVTSDEHENLVAVVKEKNLDLENSSVCFPPKKTVKLSSLIETERLLSAKHSPKGLIIMKGRNILKNKELQSSSILDVAPTVLALMGFPVETDMDGRVIEEAFEEGFFRRGPIRYVDSYADYFGTDGIEGQRETQETVFKDDVGEIEKKLRGLGYL